MLPKEIEEQEKLIEEAKSKKNEAVKSQNFELAASFRDVYAMIPVINRVILSR